MQPVVVVIVFGVIALAELPDKTMFASLALATRYRPLWVWWGAAAAFLVHVCVAVAAGGFLGLLPHRVVEAVVAALFAGGAAYLLLGGEEAAEREGEEAGTQAITRTETEMPTLRRVVLTAFGVVFVGEWGDITQIATANYAARYHDPISVGLGALLGLWVASALAVTAGARLLNYVSATVVRRVTGVVLLAFAAFSLVEAVRG